MKKQNESWREKEKRENQESRKRFDKVRVLNENLRIIQDEDYDKEILKDFLKLNLIQQNNILGFSQYSNEDILKRVLSELENFNKNIAKVISEITEEIPKKHIPSELPNDKYIRSFQLAKLLGVSRAAVTQWVNSGYFDNVKRESNGRLVSISYSSIDNFVDKYKNYEKDWKNYLQSGINL